MRRSARSSRRSSRPSGSAATSRRLAEAYRDELDRLGFWDRDGLRGRAVERLASEFGAWSGEPVFAYGFEDLTGAEWALLEALSARADVTVSIPYEPGRAAFASLERTVEDLAGLAAGSIEELGPSREQVDGRFPAPLAHLERELFADRPAPSASLDGAIGFLEGAGARGTTELVAAEVLELLRSGTPPERVGVVCDSVDRWRAVARDGLRPARNPVRDRAARSGSGRPRSAARCSVCSASHGSRAGEATSFAYLRSPFSGLERRSVDFVEGRLRGRAIAEPGRVAEETERLRGAPLPALDRLRDAVEPTSAVRELIERWHAAPGAWRRRRRRTTARADARAYQAVARTLDELEAFAPPRGRTARGRRGRRRARADDRPAGWRRRGRACRGPRLSPGADTRVRRRRSSSVSRRAASRVATGPSPFLDDDARRDLGGRLERVDSVARDRYLFYTACTRASRRLVLAREAATDDGVPREPSPFWDDVRALFDTGEVARATHRRPLSSLTWTLESAPSDRERLRAVARLSVDEGGRASALAAANGWTRRLDRALTAFDRPTDARRAPVSSAGSEHERRSPRPSSSASPTARPPGSSSA